MVIVILQVYFCMYILMMRYISARPLSYVEYEDLCASINPSSILYSVSVIFIWFLWEINRIMTRHYITWMMITSYVTMTMYTIINLLFLSKLLMTPPLGANHLLKLTLEVHGHIQKGATENAHWFLQNVHTMWMRSIWTWNLISKSLSHFNSIRIQITYSASKFNCCNNTFLLIFSFSLFFLNSLFS